ncbi:hypothetical protein WCT98_17385, partial [Pectobacterium brasiliense]|uniref:hypothetical protein n=2 Tax=Pectobacterium brasiliense TaxID=180957 RepID=UPI003016516D
QASNTWKAPVERQGLFAMGNLGCYLQRFAHRCGSIAVYPTDNLTAKRYGAKIDLLPDITQWFSVSGSLFRTTNCYF